MIQGDKEDEVLYWCMPCLEQAEPALETTMLSWYYNLRLTIRQLILRRSSPLGVLVIAAMILGSGGEQAFAQSATSAAKPSSIDTPGGSHASLDLRVPPTDSDNWLFPITKLNESLPSWVHFGGQFRDRTESQDGLGYAPVNDVYDLTQLRLGLYLQPTKWLKLVGVTQDSRVFFNHHVGNVPSYQNIWDVREAYLEVGNTTEGWYDLTVGRKIFSFGDERVIGPSDWSNMGRTFDTARLDLRFEAFKASIFAASVISAVDGQIDHHIQGNNLYGFYGGLTHLIPHATLEPYLFWRLAPAGIRLAETAGRGHLNEVTGGARLAGTVGKAVDYDVEMHQQTGSLGRNSIDAWAGHWNAGYTLKGMRAAPKLFAEYNYATGNKNPTGTTWSTHDQLYPSAHNKMDFADQFGWKNIKDFRTGVAEKLGAKWKLTQIFDDMWLATKNDAVYATSGSIAIAAHPHATSSHLGTELDLIGDYKQNTHIAYGFGFAHIFTGAYLNQATRGKDYNYPFAYTTYVF